VDGGKALRTLENARYSFAVPRATKCQPCENQGRVVDWSCANGSAWLTGGNAAIL
jgi:hypothetical protein